LTSVTYDERVAELDALSVNMLIPAEEECLATFWRQASIAAYHWRCDIPARHLPAQSVSLKASLMDWDMEKDQIVLRHHRGVGVWQFLGDDFRSRVAFALQDQGVRTMMEVDDLYLYSPPRSVGSRGAWASTPEEGRKTGLMYNHEEHRILTPQFDGIICSTESLAREYREFNDNIYVCPNSIDTADWHERPDRKDDVFRIGYYGGSSHLHDWPLVKKALKWASRQKGVEVVMLGFAPPGSSYRTYPWTDDLRAARENLYTLDLGVAPLKQGRFSNGKSDIKAMEYAMAGACPLMQQAEPYGPWKHMFPDLMIEDWEDAIRYCVKNQDECRDYAKMAKTYVLRERTIEKNVHLWKEAILGY
jgi:hypothetical protein